jgi:acyl-CoA thioesterase
VEATIENVKNDQFAKLLGIEIVEVRIGYALLKLQVEKKHLNGIGMVQGGALFTLADYAFGVAANADGSIVVGINAGISYFETPKGKTIYAEAMEENSNKKICGYKVLVKDEDGSLVASFSGLGYRKYKK